jgi:hypothetical protein
VQPHWDVIIFLHLPTNIVLWDPTVRITTPMKTASAASKTETNGDNTNLETDTPDIINNPGSAEKMEI